jgi:hypothetical protein
MSHLLWVSTLDFPACQQKCTCIRAECKRWLRVVNVQGRDGVQVLPEGLVAERSRSPWIRAARMSE